MDGMLFELIKLPVMQLRCKQCLSASVAFQTVEQMGIKSGSQLTLKHCQQISDLRFACVEYLGLTN